jgi:hypothetical protein
MCGNWVLAKKKARTRLSAAADPSSTPAKEELSMDFRTKKALDFRQGAKIHQQKSMIRSKLLILLTLFSCRFRLALTTSLLLKCVNKKNNVAR